MRGISWLAANQLASQEGLCTVEQVSKYSYLSIVSSEHCRYIFPNSWGSEDIIAILLSLSLSLSLSLYIYIYIYIYSAVWINKLARFSVLSKAWVWGRSLARIWVRVRRRHGCLPLVVVVFRQVGLSATGRSLVQRGPTSCGVSEYDSEASTKMMSWLSSHEKKRK